MSGSGKARWSPRAISWRRSIRGPIRWPWSRTRASSRTTRALLDQAQADLKRYQTLGRQDSIARQQVEDQRFVVEQYQGTVKVDQGVIDNDKLNMAYCRITAPVSGRVGLRQVDPGNYVQLSDANGIVVLTQLDPISVIFTVARGQPAADHAAARRRGDAAGRRL